MVDYNFQPINPVQSVMQGLQVGMGLRQQEMQQKLAEEQRIRDEKMRKRQEEVIDRVTSPNRTADDIFEASILLPENMRKGMLEGWKALGDERQREQMSFASQVLSGLNSGREDVSARLLESKAEAAQNSGNESEAKAYRDMAKFIRLDPKNAFLSFATQVATLPGGKDAIAGIMDIREEQRKIKLQPSEIAKAAADLELTQAQTAKEVAQAKKTEAEISKVNAEAGKVATEAAKLKMEMKKKAFPELSRDGEKLLNDAVDASVNSASLARQYDALAADIEKEMATPGVAGRAVEATKRIFGDEDNVTRIRQEFKRLRNSAVLKMLPPGVASDKDIEIAMEAFPEATASPDLVASFMRGMAKMQRYDSQLNEKRAAWVQRVGSLGAPSEEIEIDDDVVAPKTSFSDYMDGVFTEESAESVSGETASAPVDAVTITTQADYDALPAGTEYIHPDGTRRRKR